MSDEKIQVESKLPVLEYEHVPDKETSSAGEKTSKESLAVDSASECPEAGEVVYRLYKRRFAGLVALVFLNIVAAMSWPWFGPISNNMAADFNITLDQVNWLGNSVSLIYLPTAFAIPYIVARYGLRRCYDLGAIALILAAWVRFAGTAKTLSGGRAYALLILGQMFGAVGQAIYQVLGPKYSETWFNLKGRTTATMIIAISNPVGGAVGQLISPLVGSTRQSILVLGIILTAVTPLVFLIGNAPPTPPTYAGSKPSPSLFSLLRAMAGLEVHPDAYMTRRERIDFGIITIVFGTLVGATNAFAILTGQILVPFGYSDVISGIMGACLLLTGIVAAIITAPLFDRVFTYQLALTTKVLVPCVAATWLSLIWAVKPHNEAGLFVVMTIIGVCAVPMLPVGLELACEVTRNADGSSAILWFAGNIVGVMFILVQGALRADVNANPPLNMHHALIFNGAFIMTASSLAFFVKGKQARKSLDEEKLKQALEANNTVR
ncbi:MFS general substrate transporter [Macrolepiota fuliginosa MF-IS2]|uniref:MFS general substrate transporter n=1 Tax=Macrolepiota fuliginosa MF-IS2 TaxID=1400762 RepID=A0A9P5XBG0_9AGAR|nr:MFS general substrate transporter [Macrolepiota fuliginosa MF-IS2]